MITTETYIKFKEHYFNTLAEKIGESISSKMFFDSLCGILSVTSDRWTLNATPGWNDDEIAVDVCDNDTGDIVYTTSVEMNVTGDLSTDILEYNKVMKPYLTIFFTSLDVEASFEALHSIENNCK